MRLGTRAALNGVSLERRQLVTYGDNLLYFTFHQFLLKRHYYLRSDRNTYGIRRAMEFHVKFRNYVKFHRTSNAIVLLHTYPKVGISMKHHYSLEL